MKVETARKEIPFAFSIEKESLPRCLTVRMDITEGCNLGCRMCNIRDKQTQKKEEGREEIYIKFSLISTLILYLALKLCQ